MKYKYDANFDWLPCNKWVPFPAMHLEMYQNYEQSSQKSGENMRGQSVDFN